MQLSSASTAGRERCSADWSGGGGWGFRSGTEDDQEDLNETITAELRKSGNHGDSFCYKFKQSTVSTIDTKGLDEELAEAVDKDFYENYKMWKTDHPNATTRQQVKFPDQKVLSLV